VTIDLKPASMRRNGAVNDSQTEPGTVRVGGLEELLPQIADGRAVHSDTVVSNRQPNERLAGAVLPGHARHADFDDAVRLPNGVGRVLHQFEQHTLHCGGIDLHQRRVRVYGNAQYGRIGNGSAHHRKRISHYGAK
jgi:hypothetical protein